MIFPKLLAMLIKFKNHYPDYPVKTLRMDNAQEFRSHTFEDYCLASGIDLTYSFPYEHAQNGLAEAFIKKVQLITRPLLLHAKLPSSMWGHAVIHAAALLRLRPTMLNSHSSFELLSGRVPNVSHLRIFGCQVWVPVAEPQKKTISSHRQEGIYVGFDSPSIIRYVSPTTGTLLRAQFKNCKFVEHVFPTLPTIKPSIALDFWAPETYTLNPDPRTALTDTEVKKLLHLQSLADRVPDGFSNSTCVTRNPLPGIRLPPVTVLPAKSILPVKRKSGPSSSSTPLTLHTIVEIPPELDTQFICPPEHSPLVTTLITRITQVEPDPLTLAKAKTSSDWPQWSEALKAEYHSLRKRNVFGPLVTNLSHKPIGFKLIFTRKRDAQGHVIRFKVRLVAQGFTQRPGIDFAFTYSPVMDSTSFRYLLGLAVQYSLETQLMDVVTAYLYGPLDADIYIRPPPEFLTEVTPADTPGKFSGLKLLRALYGLKQGGRMWYQHLRDFLLSHNFRHDSTLPCIFTYKDTNGFVIIAVYVDDLNLVGTPLACKHVVALLTSKFEMKLLGKTSFCLGLQIAHLTDGSIFLHQTTYTQRLLKNFDMDQANPLSTPMIGRNRTFEDPYRPCEEEEEFDNKPRYLAAVGALLYLSTYTRPDIAFHEASREVVWLRTMDKILMEQSELNSTNKPTIIFEDNAACIAQVTSGFIKADRTKHISPQIFGFS